MELRIYVVYLYITKRKNNDTMKKSTKKSPVLQLDVFTPQTQNFISEYENLVKEYVETQVVEETVVEETVEDTVETPVYMEVVKDLETVEETVETPVVKKYEVSEVEDLENCFEFEKGFSLMDVQIMRKIYSVTDEAAEVVERLLAARKYRGALKKNGSKLNILMTQWLELKQLIGADTFNLYVKRQYKHQFNSPLKSPVQPFEIDFEDYIGVPLELR